MIIYLITHFALAFSDSSPQKVKINQSYEPLTVCEELFKSLTPNSHKDVLKDTAKLCEGLQVLSECHSVKDVPIFHFSKSSSNKTAQKILVFSLIHGNEAPSGSASLLWLARLKEIDPRNNWRVVPVLNPDGYKNNTRVNANKVDLNRNFPTKDWNELAIKHWKTEGKASPRLFPGDAAGTEPEVKCALQHISEFQPDFIVSIHTPLKVLDYDGPKVHVQTPASAELPWKSLGHFPGSLGRYMWFERKTPTLTMELAPQLPRAKDSLVKLQDLVGKLVAIDLKKPEDTHPSSLLED